MIARSALPAAALACVALALALVHVRASADDAREAARPRRVVLFVGDGMGLPHVTLGRLAAQRLGRPYAFDRFPVTGLCSTVSADRVVTDSGAASTALATGVKTRNGAIGVDAAGVPRRTILEVARDAGYRTGLVTTTRITHATPACFAAHVRDREDEDEIARQYAECGATLLFGGGRAHFPDERLRELRARGWTVALDLAGLRGLAPVTTRAIGVFAADHLAYEIDRDPAREPSLRELTERALDLLGSEGRPFFCMIEGGRIDHAGHVHDAPALLAEQLAFADAVEVALERVERGGDLLVLVTADHSTGGTSVTETLDLEGLARVHVSVEKLVADHPRHVLTGSADEYRALMEKHYGFTPTALDLATARRGFGPYGNLTPVGHVLSLRFGVAFFDLDFQQQGQKLTHGHEGSLVPVFAAGPGSSGFSGTYENARIPIEIARLLRIPHPGQAIGREPARYR